MTALTAARNAIDSGSYDGLILTAIVVLGAVIWLWRINGGDKW